MIWPPHFLVLGTQDRLGWAEHTASPPPASRIRKLVTPAAQAAFRERTGGGEGGGADRPEAVALGLSCWLSQASSQRWAVSQSPGTRRARASSGPCELRHLPEPARQAAFLTHSLTPSAGPWGCLGRQRYPATRSLGPCGLLEGTFFLSEKRSSKQPTPPRPPPQTNQRERRHWEGFRAWARGGGRPGGWTHPPAAPASSPGPPSFDSLQVCLINCPTALSWAGSILACSLGLF